MTEPMEAPSSKSIGLLAIAMLATVGFIMVALDVVVLFSNIATNDIFSLEQNKVDETRKKLIHRKKKARRHIKLFGRMA